jgi:hypothetical protein
MRSSPALAPSEDVPFLTALLMPTGCTSLSENAGEEINVIGVGGAYREPDPLLAGKRVRRGP